MLENIKSLLAARLFLASAHQKAIFIHCESAEYESKKFGLIIARLSWLAQSFPSSSSSSQASIDRTWGSRTCYCHVPSTACMPDAVEKKA
jgi:hypothetical protein